MSFLAAFAGLAWKTQVCYFAELSICGTQLVVVETVKVLWQFITPFTPQATTRVRLHCKLCVKCVKVTKGKHPQECQPLHLKDQIKISAFKEFTERGICH